MSSLEGVRIQRHAVVMDSLELFKIVGTVGVVVITDIVGIVAVVGIFRLSSRIGWIRSETLVQGQNDQKRFRQIAQYSDSSDDTGCL